MLILEMVIKPRLARRVWRKLRFRDRRGAGAAAPQRSEDVAARWSRLRHL